MKEQEIINSITEWLRDTVIGLNLCPFAKKPYLNGQIRIVVANSSDVEVVFTTLMSELELISKAVKSDLETTVVVCPHALNDFDQYLDFLDVANSALCQLGFEGILQLASFHPAYVFAGVDEKDQSNFTNRSPYPIFHIIREDSLTEINEKPEMLEKIPDRNIELMRRMKRAELEKHFSWFFNND